MVHGNNAIGNSQASHELPNSKPDKATSAPFDSPSSQTCFQAAAKSMYEREKEEIRPEPLTQMHWSEYLES